MSLIRGLVIKSKYSKTQSIFSKIYLLGEEKKVLDIIVHAERLLNIVYTAFSNFVDIKMILGIYFIYYRDCNGKREPRSFIAEEPVSIRINRNDFKPTIYGFDFISGEFTPNIRNINAEYDIDMECKSISIDITAEVSINLVEERDIILKENIADNSEEDEMEDFEEIPLRSVAISRDYAVDEIKGFINPMGEISKNINPRFIENEAEYKALKKEIDKLYEDINEKKYQYLSLSEKYLNICKEYSKQIENLKTIERRYIREQKRSGQLEADNSKKIEEIKRLIRDKEELLKKIEENKSSIKGKLKQLIAGK